MILEFGIFAVSLAALIFSSDKLVEVCISAARKFSISPMVIGLTVVAIGTSLPEVAASVAAALKGYPTIAFGNVLGSNICNVGLILGTAALVSPVMCVRKVLDREGVLMLAASVFLYALAAWRHDLSTLDGVLLLLGFLVFLVIVIRSAIAETAEQIEESEELSTSTLVFWLVGSIVVLLVSSEFLVSSTVSIATTLGVSEQLIAISIVALGTSLPELSVSIAAARRKEGSILVGNIIGSNITNIFLVLGLASVITPLHISESSIEIDLLIMLLFAVLMLAFLSMKSGITRNKGILLVALYAGFVWYCAAQHIVM